MTKSVKIKMNNPKKYLYFLSILLSQLISCSEKKSNIPQPSSQNTDIEFKNPIFHKDSMEYFKHRRSRPDFENKSLIESSDEAKVVFNKYYDELLKSATVSKNGLSEVKRDTDGYYYSEIIGESWYIFVKHGDGFVFDGGFAPH